MVRVHFGPPLLKKLKWTASLRETEDFEFRKPKWTRKAALRNSPVDCFNRRGFSAEKRVHGKFAQSEIWGYSSAGRALEWHSRGQRFDPAYLHHFLKWKVKSVEWKVWRLIEVLSEMKTFH